jgi:hypothetical protein
MFVIKIKTKTNLGDSSLDVDGIARGDSDGRAVV